MVKTTQHNIIISHMVHRVYNYDTDYIKKKHTRDVYQHLS